MPKSDKHRSCKAQLKKLIVIHTLANNELKVYTVVCGVSNELDH